MTINAWIQVGIFLAVLLALVKPLGWYMARVYQGQPCGLDRALGWLERGLLRVAGVDPQKEMTWRTYAIGVLLFNAIGLVALYAILRLQDVLPLNQNPDEFKAVEPGLAFNTAVSFATNTNWQSYGGESTLSYLTQMLGLGVQNFLSAATGMAVLDREMKEASRWGWLFYRRVKTGKSFCRPMNRVVNAHIKSIMPGNPAPDDPVFLGGSARPNVWFQELCEIAGIKSRTNFEMGKEVPWLLKDLRKTCATCYDAHIPESSIDILGHSVGGITYRHYAHRAPLACKAILTLPQPTAFMALVKGYDGECPCCRRPFTEA